ncbi:MAG: hypothetical protein RBR32_07820 [Bacteroidales bacterium]|nr:hypothetical protein [Bacteroidales bacterium]
MIEVMLSENGIHFDLIGITNGYEMKYEYPQSYCTIFSYAPKQLIFCLYISNNLYIAIKDKLLNCYNKIIQLKFRSNYYEGFIKIITMEVHNEVFYCDCILDNAKEIDNKDSELYFGNVTDFKMDTKKEKPKKEEKVYKKRLLI